MVTVVLMGSVIAAMAVDQWLSARKRKAAERDEIEL